MDSVHSNHRIEGNVQPSPKRRKVEATAQVPPKLTQDNKEEMQFVTARVFFDSNHQEGVSFRVDGAKIVVHAKNQSTYCFVCEENHNGDRVFQFTMEECVRLRLVRCCLTGCQRDTSGPGLSTMLHQRPIFHAGVLDLPKTRKIINDLQRLPLGERFSRTTAIALCTDARFAPLHFAAGTKKHKSMTCSIKRSLITTSTRDLILDVVSNASKQGFLKLSLKTGKKGTRSVGRIYGTKSCVLLPRKLRAILLNDWVELDQENSHPRHFLALAKETLLDGSYEVLIALVNQRDDVFTELQCFYGVEKGDIKLLVLKVGYGGKLSKFVKEHSKINTDKIHPMLKEYQDVLKKLTNGLRWRNPALYEEAQRDEEYTGKWKQTILSLFAFQCETTATALACKWLIQHNKVETFNESKVAYYLMSPLHDGVWVKLREEILEQDLEDIGKFVREQTGLNTFGGIKRPDVEDEFMAVVKEHENTAKLAVVIPTLQWMSRITAQHLPSLPSPKGLDDFNRLICGDFRVAFVEIGVGGLNLFVTNVKASNLFIEKRMIADDMVFNGLSKKLGEDRGRAVADDMFEGIPKTQVVVQFSHCRDEYFKGKIPKEGVTFMKISMCGGKSYLVYNVPIKNACSDNRSVLSIAPRRQLVKQQVAFAQNRGVPMTCYLDPMSATRRGSVVGPEVPQPQTERDPTIMRFFKKATKPVPTQVPTEEPELNETKYCDPLAAVTTLHNFEPFEHDLLFMDEFTTLIECTLSKTLLQHKGVRADYVMDIWQNKIREAKQVIVADADLDKSAVEWIEDRRGKDDLHGIYFANSSKRLDVFLANTKNEVYSQLLQSVFLSNQPVLFICSTTNGPNDLHKLMLDFVNGEIDITGNKRQSNALTVLSELMVWHSFQTNDQAKAFVKERVDGVCKLHGTQTDVERMDKLVGHFYEDGSDGSIFPTREDYSFQDDKWMKRELEDDKWVKTWVLAQSPIISVGSSSQTTYFKAAFAVFDTVTYAICLLIQQLFRVRTLRKPLVFLGRLYESFDDITTKQATAKDVVSCHHGELTIDMKPLLKEAQKNAWNRKMLRGSFASDFASRLIHSNPFNTINPLPGSLISNHVSSSRSRKRQHMDVEVQNLLDAKPLTEHEYENKEGNSADRERFRLLNTLFEFKVIPGEIEANRDSLEILIRYNKELKYLKWALEITKDNIKNLPKVSEHVSENITVDTPLLNHGIHQLRFLVLDVLRFTSFKRFALWTNKSTCPQDLNRNHINNVDWVAFQQNPQKIEYAEATEEATLGNIMKTIKNVVKSHAPSLVLGRGEERSVNGDRHVTVVQFNTQLIHLAETLSQKKPPGDIISAASDVSKWEQQQQSKNNNNNAKSEVPEETPPIVSSFTDLIKQFNSFSTST